MRTINQSDMLYLHYHPWMSVYLVQLQHTAHCTVQFSSMVNIMCKVHVGTARDGRHPSRCHDAVVH